MSKQPSGQVWVQPYFTQNTGGEALQPNAQSEVSIPNADVDLIVAADNAPAFVKPSNYSNNSIVRLGQITFDVKDGVGLYEKMLGFSAPDSHIPDSYLFITTDPAVLAASNHTHELREKANASFFAKALGQMSLVLPIFGGEAATGMWLGSLTGNYWIGSAGLFGGAIAGAISAYSASKKVDNKIYAPVKQSERQLKKLIGNSALTVVIPDNGLLIADLSYNVKKALTTCSDRRKELSLLLPDIHDALQAEATAKIIKTRVDVLSSRATSIERTAGVRIPSEDLELTSLQHRFDTERKIAFASIARIRKINENNTKQIQFAENRLWIESTMKSTVVHNALKKTPAASTIAIINESLNHVHTVENSSAVVAFLRDFTSAIEAVSSSSIPIEPQLIKELYDTLVNKHQKDIFGLSLFDDIQR